MAGYSGTPLVRKLGIKPGQRIRLLDAPAEYWELLGGDPDRLDVRALDPDSGEAAEVTHVFAVRRAELRSALRRACAGMTRDGMVWVSWPKKSSGVETEIGRAEVMAAGKAAGLVDVKVCAVDETWSGLKFVIPVSER